MSYPDRQVIHLPVSGQDLSYTDRPGEVGTMLYIHGVGCSAGDFLPVATRSEFRGYRLVAPDLPGSGRSPYPRGRQLNMRDLAKITDEFASALELPNFTLIGHSMGVLVGLRLLQIRADVQQYIAVDSSNALWGPGTPFRARRITAAGREAFLKNGFSGFLQDCRSSRYAGFRKHAEILQTTSPESFYDYSLSMVDEADNGNLLGIYDEVRLARPHAFICAEENDDTVSHRDELRSHGVEVYTTPGHHFPFYDDPDAFYGVLARILKENP